MQNMHNVSTQEKPVGGTRNIGPMTNIMPNCFPSNLPNQPTASFGHADWEAIAGYGYLHQGWNLPQLQTYPAMHDNSSSVFGMEQDPMIQPHLQAFSGQPNFTPARPNSAAWPPNFVPKQYHFIQGQNNFMPGQSNVAREEHRRVAQSVMPSEAIDVMRMSESKHFQTGLEGNVLPARSDSMQDHLWQQISETPLGGFGHVPENGENQMPHLDPLAFFNSLTDEHPQEDEPMIADNFRNSLRTTEDLMLYPGSVAQDADDEAETTSQDNFCGLPGTEVGQPVEDAESTSHEDLCELYETLYGWQEEAPEVTGKSLNTLTSTEESISNPESEVQEAGGEVEPALQDDLGSLFESIDSPQDEAPVISDVPVNTLKVIEDLVPNAEPRVEDADHDLEWASQDDLYNFFGTGDSLPVELNLATLSGLGDSVPEFGTDDILGEALEPVKSQVPMTETCANDANEVKSKTKL